MPEITLIFLPFHVCNPPVKQLAHLQKVAFELAAHQVGVIEPHCRTAVLAYHLMEQAFLWMAGFYA